MLNYLQYDVVIVNLDPTIGSEMKKKRPCLIVSPNEINKNLSTITVCPITSQSKKYPTRVLFELDEVPNWIVIDQIRTIDKNRITKIIASLDADSIIKVKAIIKETFVD